MYSAYGNNVLKRYQVNMGVPYPVKQRQVSQAIKEEKPQIKEEEDDIVEIATAQADTIIKEAKEEEKIGRAHV